MKRWILLYIFVLSFFSLKAEYQLLPVADKGRFLPLDVYARLYLQDFYGKQHIKKSDLGSFPTKEPSALTFFLHLYFYGHEPFDEAPLFSIHYAELKKILGLSLKKEHFSYNQIKEAIFKKESNVALMRLLIPYFFVKQGGNITSTQEIPQLAPGLFVGIKGKDLILLKTPDFPPWDFLTPGMVITKDIYEQLTLIEKTAKLYTEEAIDLLDKMNRYEALPEFKVLPSKKKETWLPLETLKNKKNQTAYPDAIYDQLQKSYFELEKDPAQFKVLGKQLHAAYSLIAGTPSKEAYNKVLYYPTTRQLKAEFIYYHYPFITIAIIFYFIALIYFILNKKNSALTFLSIAFTLHTLILCLRCFILNRPPVSNMFETVIYVPWISMIAGFAFFYFNKNSLLLMASNVCALVLLVLLNVIGMNERLENVQAVLDSNYWLIIHVLLIVGSYGLFFLSGILGALYLIYDYLNEEENPSLKMHSLEKFILQTLYLGVFMLIPGTILGGVWAAESWGRFWDWDPKESWAFISASVYLIWIHAYRFHQIGAFGLSVGSLIGLLTISFTWYGVNYILGTGLHSYGFGSGKDLYYYIFLISVVSFLIFIFYRHKKRLEIKRRNLL